MKYERLTKRDSNGKAHYIKTPQSSYIQTVLEEQKEIEKEGLDRLCDLETKIENGTLIELPVDFGTELYFLHSHQHADKPYPPTIHKTNKWTFEIWGNGKSGISCDDLPCGYYGIYRHELGKTVFLTREEAEKRLKEI